jgi:hypothetical protein
MGECSAAFTHEHTPNHRFLGVHIQEQGICNCPGVFSF